MDELSVKCLLHADDQVILTPSVCELQEMVTKMNDFIKKSGMMSDERSSGLIYGDGGVMEVNLGHRNSHSLDEIKQQKILLYEQRKVHVPIPISDPGVDPIPINWHRIFDIEHESEASEAEVDRRNSHSLAETKQRKLLLYVCVLWECGVSRFEPAYFRAAAKLTTCL
ncbi:hypothetical protein EVAR_90179_1 [Eumeta japonica]|uniref:Reverse transcriptase domain-containing protein n=1 Tax=Eumeta variegata TaxID=151549 RepID=A0A4C1WYG6_EUMVA|nr:hypothetical protein EVAR_90179_1 [Eumeta japonica]